MEMNIKTMGLVIALWVFSIQAMATESIIRLEHFVSKADYQQAWKQAKRLVKTNEGDPRFDYLYGLSALETGHYDKAVFALERVITNQPNVIRPRLELARAYLKVNNNPAALHEFRQVLRLNPPAIVRSNVSRYIQAMRKSSKKNKKWVVDGLITLVGGYDSNVNFGAENATFDVPIFGSVILKDESLKQDSPFVEVRGKLNYRYVVSEAQNWFLKTSVGHKHFSNAKAFNLSDLSVQGGGLFAVGKQQYKLAVRHQTLKLNDKVFSHTLGLDAGIARELADDRMIAATLSLENYENKKQFLRDTRRYQLSTQYGFKKANINHQFEALLGVEKSKYKAGKYHARNSIGLAYSAKQDWNTIHSSNLTVQLQDYKHSEKNPIYNIKRKDKRLIVKVGHSISLAKKVSAFADIAYIKNNSNLGLYKTAKKIAKIGINYHF